MKAMKVAELRGYHARKQAAGLRLIRLWVPDTRSRRFAAEVGALEFIKHAG